MLDFIALAQQCAPLVAPETMAAIVRTESGFRPLAIGVNGGARLARQPETVGEAVATAKWLIKNGYSIDLGLGQINSKNLARTGLTVEDAFDPCKNLAAGAMILQENYKDASRKYGGGQAALNAAFSAYNTGSFTAGFSNGYVQRVVNNASTKPDPVPKPTSPIPLLIKATSQSGAGRASKESPAQARTEPETEPVDSWNVYQSSSRNVLAF